MIHILPVLYIVSILTYVNYFRLPGVRATQTSESMASAPSCGVNYLVSPLVTLIPSYLLLLPLRPMLLLYTTVTRMSVTTTTTRHMSLLSKSVTRCHCYTHLSHDAIATHTCHLMSLLHTSVIRCQSTHTCFKMSPLLTLVT